MVIEFRDESGARIGRLVFPNACKFPRKRNRRIRRIRDATLSLSRNIVVVVVVVVDQRASLITLRILIIAVLSLSLPPFSFQRNSLLLFEIERVDRGKISFAREIPLLEIRIEITRIFSFGILRHLPFFLSLSSFLSTEKKKERRGEGKTRLAN